MVDTYKDITEFLHLIKLRNIVNSLKYLGTELDTIYFNKKELVIETYLLLVEQYTLEDFVFFLPSDSICFLLKSLKISIKRSRNKDMEKFMEYLIKNGLYSYLYNNTSLYDIVLLCNHTGIDINNDDIIDSDIQKNLLDKQSNLKPEDKIRLSLVTLKDSPIIRLKYTNMILDELILRGFRATLFEQSLAMSREWMRDIGGPVAGSKQAVVERVITTMLKIKEEYITISAEREAYQQKIAERLRIKPGNKSSKKKTSVTPSPKKKRKSSKVIQRKNRKPKNIKLSRSMRKITPVPHPDDYIQDLDYIHGGTREPIIKGVTTHTLMVEYTHAELRNYCSFFRLNQTGKKTTLVDRIQSFLNNYDYKNKRPGGGDVIETSSNIKEENDNEEDEENEENEDDEEDNDSIIELGKRSSYKGKEPVYKKPKINQTEVFNEDTDNEEEEEEEEEFIDIL